MTLEGLLQQIKSTPQTIDFTTVINTIDAHYQYTPTRFSNGNIVNESGTNEGSCKIFAFAHLQKLTIDETLACFGTYYRDDVLKSPDASDHANIRHFMQTGWNGISFDSIALTQ